MPLLPGRDVFWIFAIAVGLLFAVLTGMLATLAFVDFTGLYEVQDETFDSPWFEYLLMILYLGGFLTATHGFFVMHRSVSWNELGLRSFNFRSIRTLIIIVGVCWGFQIGFNQSGDLTPVERYILPVNPTPILIAVFLFLYGPLTAVTEELLFRGLVHRWIRQRLTVIPGACISAAFFAAAHFYFLEPGGDAGWNSTLFVWIFGLLAAALYEKSHSLWPPIVVHMISNFIFIFNGLIKTIR